MKILYVVHDFFPRFYGGTERYVLNISKQIQRMGHFVTVLTYGIEDSLDNYYEMSEDIFYRCYSYDGIPVISIRHKMIPVDIGYIIQNNTIEKALEKIITNKSFDIVHIAHPMRMSSCYKVAKKNDIPVVLTLTDFWLLCPRGRFFKPDYSLCNSPEKGKKCINECAVNINVIERFKESKRLFDEVDALISPSRFLIEIFRANDYDKEIIHINHGVDYINIKPFKPATKESKNIVFAYTGVIGRFKGADLLINSFMDVQSDNIILKFYGDILWDLEMHEILNSAMKKDKRIKIMGKYDHSELPFVMGDSDVVVVPSTTLESYGLVVIESLAYRVPVIASDIVGSAYEFITDGKNGFIFKVNKPETLKDIIENISQNPDIVQKLKKNISPPPRIEEEAFQLESIYKHLL